MSHPSCTVRAGSSSGWRRRGRSTDARPCRRRGCCRTRRGTCPDCRVDAAGCSASGAQFWAPVPLQVQSWIFVPSAVPPPATSRHLPSARSVCPVRGPRLRGGAVAGVELDLRAVGGARRCARRDTCRPARRPARCRRRAAAGGERERVDVEERAGAGRRRSGRAWWCPPARRSACRDTLVKVSQPPVTGTVAEPSTVPVGEPARTWSVPPAPPEETRAVNDVALSSRTGRTRSSRRCRCRRRSCRPRRWPWSNVSMPDEVLKCSACRCRGCRVCCVCVVSPPLSVYSASKTREDVRRVVVLTVDRDR